MGETGFVGDVASGLDSTSLDAYLKDLADRRESTGVADHSCRQRLLDTARTNFEGTNIRFMKVESSRHTVIIDTGRNIDDAPDDGPVKTLPRAIVFDELGLYVGRGVPIGVIDADPPPQFMHGPIDEDDLEKLSAMCPLPRGRLGVADASIEGANLVILLNTSPAVDVKGDAAYEMSMDDPDARTNFSLTTIGPISNCTYPNPQASGQVKDLNRELIRRVNGDMEKIVDLRSDELEKLHVAGETGPMHARARRDHAIKEFESLVGKFK